MWQTVHVFNHNFLPENAYKWKNKVDRYKLEMLRDRLIIFVHAFVHLWKLPFPWAHRNTKLQYVLLMSTESPYHFDHLLQVSNKSLWILILYTFFNVFPHVYSPLGRGRQPLCGQNPNVTQKALSFCPFVARYLWSLILDIIFHVFIQG